MLKEFLNGIENVFIFYLFKKSKIVRVYDKIENFIFIIVL